MRLLLTSGGVTNASIEAALVELLGRPISGCDALCIPTAQYAHPWVGPGVKPWGFISGTEPHALTALGWRSVGVLELTALPSIPRDLWEPTVRSADVLLAAGGDTAYLAHWMRGSGLADLLPELDVVWVGLSAGSMVMTPRVGADFVQWEPLSGDDRQLGLVDFCLCPHLAEDGQPGNSMAECEAWAAGIGHPAYIVDDQTALVVTDDGVEVVSEGRWRYVEPPV
jgi:dipeptidase E